jgi:hypothetical protein
VSENTPNSVSVKVSRATYDSLNDEQARLRRETGEKPTLQELLDSAWSARKSAIEGKPADQGGAAIPPRYRPSLKALREVLSCGDDDLIGLVVKPLEFAQRELRRRAAAAAGKDAQ